ncbi:hypothetical protein K438DRAFT_1795674 [Mycena galopus ATCC 62051]|nr:hypothetical protein K438DRAFT_1795674 [Mycena galopus ATCC 62051]
MMAKDRKTSYKTPPISAANVAESQELRRRKALDEQKRKRAQRVDSSRQLDLFADLNLGQSDDEEGAEDPGIVRIGISSYAPLLPPSASAAEAPAADVRMASMSVSGSEPLTERNKNKKKKKRKPKTKKEQYSATGSEWADQCMYAELLEMSEDTPWDMLGSSPDGLPEDLETGWVAVAPVPVGKRCLAVTDPSLGVPGLVPNTSLRSRKLGKLLMPRFPSTLPPLTMLDCILDDNWRENGVLHILDVLKWKGQDIGDCETQFRFWWRDTRLGELSPSPPPSSSHYNKPFDPTDSNVHPKPYRFPYPTKFLGVPYHLDTSLPTLASQIVPCSRASRFIDIAVPADADPESAESMAVDQCEPAATVFTTRTAEIRADGLLLYVAEASYESGTSPLSSWIPITKYEEDPILNGRTESGTTTTADGPLDVFHRLVEKRIARSSDSEYGSGSLTMDVET